MRLSRRAPILVLIPTLLAVLALATQDHASELREPITEGGGDPRAALLPTATAATALSSTFYCAGASAAPNDPFDAVVVVANASAAALTARVTVYPAAADGDQKGIEAVATLQPRAIDLPVPATSRAELRLAEVQQSPFAAALVEVSGGEVAVERRTIGPRGVSTSPCASAPSASWYLPSGVTTRHARELLALFNPFAHNAVLDISFITTDGFRAPPPYQGYVVEAGSLAVIDVGAAAGRHPQVSTVVRTRSGRLVVDRLQSFDGSDPAYAASAAASLAAPQPAAVWGFAEGLVADGINESYAILNPSDGPAAVQLEIVLDDPNTNGVVDPITLDVPPRAYAQVVMNEQTRVPADIGHSVTVRSTNGTPVVAERVFSTVAPAGRRGYGPQLGAPVVATRWLFADGRADSVFAQYLVLSNPSADLARVKVTALAQGLPLALDGLQSLEVPAGGRVSVELGRHVNRVDLTVLVEADRPLFAERGLYVASGTGVSLARGVPLLDGLAAPPPPLPTTTLVISGEGSS